MFDTLADDIVELGGEALLDAVLTEFRRGEEVERALVAAEQAKLATACSRLESSAIEGLGYIDSDIPAESYFHWINEGRKRGVKNIWKEAEFRRDYLRDNPQCRVRYRPKPMSGWRAPALEQAAAQGRQQRKQQLIITA